MKKHHKKNSEEPDNISAITALQISEMRYRRLFESACNGILILNAMTGNIIDVNPYLLNLLGLSRKNVLKKKVWELGFLSDVIANRNKFEELRQKEYVRYDNLALEGNDGKRHEVEFISNVCQEGDSKVIQCNIRDISARRRSEKKFQTSNEKYKVLFESSSDAIIILEPLSWRFASANQHPDEIHLLMTDVIMPSMN